MDGDWKDGVLTPPPASFNPPSQISDELSVESQQRDVTEGNCMAAAENSRILRVVASVPS